MEFKLSKHTQDMMVERKILEEWVRLTINNPDYEKVGVDNNTHYFKSIPEHEGHILHVVMNLHVLPKKVVTVFFDRRARRKK